MLSLEQPISDIASLSIGDPESFLGAFTDSLRKATGAEISQFKNLRKQGAKPTQGEEFILNTGVPYLDNSLSSYSAFPELINFFNSGFKSCIILPLKMSGSFIGTITLLSRKDRFFQEGDLRMLGFFGSLASREYWLMNKAYNEAKTSDYFTSIFNVGEPKCIIDGQGAVTMSNDLFISLVGTSARSGALHNMLGLEKNYLDILRKGSAIDIPIRNGRRYRMYPVKSSSENLILTFYDVTDLELMKEKEQFFKYGNDVCLLISKDTRIKWLSGNIKDALQIDPDYLSGKKLSAIVKGSETVEKILKAAESGRSYGMLDILLGNDVSVRVACSVVQSQDGYNVILSKNTDEYIGLLKKGIDDILRFSGDMVINVDALGYIKSINKSVEKVLHYRASDLLGASISSICADADSQMRISNSLNLAKRGATASDVYVNFTVKNSQEVIPSQQVIRAAYDSTGMLSSYVLMGKELGTKRLLEHLQDAYEKSERVRETFKEESELKTQFIYSVAHDLRTPITSIQGFAKLMLEGQPFGELNKAQKDSLQTIIDESERLNELIEHILDAAKLESQKVKLDIRMVNMAELCQNAGVKSQAEVAMNKGLAFNYFVEYDVPEIECDPNRIIQVLVNLIGNAIKFTDKGSIKVHIRRNGKSKNTKMIRVEVIDTGIGIRHEDKEKLFKKFFQIENNELVRHAGKGTGLGLTIVKEIVGLHHGQTGVESEPGKGSTFWFTLPMNQKQKKV